MRKSEMLTHLMDALEDGQDIGHYGRLVLAMVGRHFVSSDELVDLLCQNPGFEEPAARALVTQVESRGYNPPKRERILEWQARQEFPICPNPEDPGACNVYRDLQFPEDVYQDIEEFYEEQAEAEEHRAA